MASLFANRGSAPASGSAAVPPGHSISTPDSWVDDDKGDVCNRCMKEVKPGIFTSGKHHCRRCGQMVCGSCSKKKISLARLGHGGDPVRVCDHCYTHELRRTACLRRYIPQLMKGNSFIKWPSGKASVGMGKQHRRVVRLTADQQTIIWHKEGESVPKATASIQVKDVTAVSNSLSTVAGRDAINRAGKSNCCISIVANTRTLDLECSNHEEARSWITAFGEFVKYAKLESPETMRASTQAKLDQIAQKEAREAERRARQEHRQKLRAKYAV